jgi:malate dehydrogenase
MRRKITVVGAGAVGSATALLIGRRPDADVVLLDLDEDRARARALDLTAAVALDAGAGSVAGGGWAHAAGSEVVVIAVGGDDALEAVGSVCDDIARRCPDAVVIVVSTPVDAATRVALERTHFPRGRVLGLGTIVDTARLRSLLALAAGVGVSEVQALVLGAHGGVLVPITSAAQIAGRPAAEVLGTDRLDTIVAAVAEAADDLLTGLGERPGLLAPAAGVAEIVAAVIDDRRRVLPCSALCQGELGITNSVLAIPVVVGAEGIADIVDVTMAETERVALLAAADA